MKTLYIVGPKSKGEGVYYLIGDQGEYLAAHFCSHAGYAPGDLEGRRPERQEEWRKEFGEYKVEFAESEELIDKLHALNCALAATAPAPSGSERSE